MSPLEPLPLAFEVCVLTRHRPRFQWRDHQWGAWCERCGACVVWAVLATPTPDTP